MAPIFFFLYTKLLGFLYETKCLLSFAFLLYHLIIVICC